MVTLSFVVAAWRLHPDLGQVARGFVPSVPHHDVTRYAFLTVSIVGATVSPYLLNFYSSGAIEEKWTQQDLWINRLTAWLRHGVRKYRSRWDASSRRRSSSGRSI